MALKGGSTSYRFSVSIPSFSLRILARVINGSSSALERLRDLEVMAQI